ncbi:MarC family protein [Piscirickettsia salmonis]|uniref:MarC family protein n=1 Tax=Piscirickettsia salmonis TaxID=1238 RepID=UPI003EC10004
MLTTLITATITLIIVMDPIGNIPVFLSVLKNVDPKRLSRIILRETLIAYIIIVSFLFGGQYILKFLGVSASALSIGGGVILFLIALKMIFPSSHNDGEVQMGEPFIVPLAIPLVAGPAALATVMISAMKDPVHTWVWFVAISISSLLTLIVLSSATLLQRLLGAKGLVAIERLMGMLLVIMSVQMLLSGVNTFFHLNQETPAVIAANNQ